MASKAFRVRRERFNCPVALASGASRRMTVLSLRSFDMSYSWCRNSMAYSFDAPSAGKKPTTTPVIVETDVTVDCSGARLQVSVNKLEARVGIEPTYKGFADLSLTTWVPRQNSRIQFRIGLHNTPQPLLGRATPRHHWLILTFSRQRPALHNARRRAAFPSPQKLALENPL